MNQLVALVYIALISAAFAQNTPHATISGFVYDATNHEALIGANIHLEGSQLGAATNDSGYYVIPRIPAGAYTLVAHFIGYETYRQQITLTAGEQQTIAINLPTGDILLEEMIVSGKNVPAAEQLYEQPLSQIRLSPQQINQIPQMAETDLLRSLQTMPGVLPVSDFSSALYVRGGTPDQNLYLMDGTDVYNPEHAFGFFSTFITDAIKQVDLSKGGFGAKYGGRLSSVLDVTNLDGNREQFKGTATISLLSAKTTLQTPLGELGSLSGSFRRTYFDKTVAPFIANAPAYYFFDGNAKAFFDLDEKNKLTISGYGSADNLRLSHNAKTKGQAGTGLTYDWGNRTGSARWTHLFSPQLFANFLVTGSRFDSNADFSQTFDSVFIEKNFITDIAFKGDFEYYPADTFKLGLGFEQKNLHIVFKRQSESGIIDVDRKPKHYAGYLFGNWRPSPLWDFETGLRYNLFDAGKNFHNLAPRFAAKYRASDTINLKAAAGVYYQYLHRVPKTFLADNWVSSNSAQRESSAQHAIFGISKDFAGAYQLEVETYYKQYSNIYAFNDNFAIDITPQDSQGEIPVYTETDGIFNRGDGDSRGIELLTRKDYGVLTGWLSYSASLTEYTFDRVNQGRAFSPRHHRAHVVNLIGNLDWRAFKRWQYGEIAAADESNWRLGFMFAYTSGQPTTLPGSTYFVRTAPDWDWVSHEVYPSAINQMRLPPYMRLDLSFTYEKRYETWSMFPYLQIFNVWNRKNIWFVDFDAIAGADNTLKGKIETIGMFPIVPTFGVNFTF